MNIPVESETLQPPDFTADDILVLKKYFEINKRYYEQVNIELTEKLIDDPFWGPFIKMQTPEQRKVQNERSMELQRAAIYEGKWDEYSKDLISQGRIYARMNVGYNDWYDIIRMYKVHIVPRIKKDLGAGLLTGLDALDYFNGLCIIVDYAMFGIAVAYFQEKNEGLRESEERFRAVFENSADQIIVIGTDRIVRLVNHVLPGMTEKEVLGRNILDLKPEAERPRIKGEIDKVFKNGKPRAYEFLHGDIYISSKASPVFNSDGNVEAAVIIARDITKEKNYEKEILNINATLEEKVKARTEELNAINKELESFSYSVSHDLRGPLRAINGFTQILSEEFGNIVSEDAKDAMSEIIGNAKRMGQLIDDLLEFSRLGKQNLSRLELNMSELVNTVISDLRKSYPGKDRASFTVRPLHRTNADSVMMRQVLLNLVSNAMKYSAKKESPEIEIGSFEENGSHVYYVKDNGAGFDMAYYDKLFGVFQRLHRTDEFEGTGVGLAIVQRIILRHSGKVWAEGKVNEGATFYFSLPKQLSNQ